MRCILQRSREASVTVDGLVTGQIDHGLVLLVGIGPGDTEETLAWMARKLAGLRVFNDEDGRFAQSVRDVGGSILSISQFTLYGDASRGTRPGFSSAAPADQAERMWLRFNQLLEAEGLDVQCGVFGAYMQVALVNDGPVTMQLER